MAYENFSMSVRACDAYGRGLLPASKMVAKLKKAFPKSFRGLTTAIFTAVVPRADEWHHTSCKFNATNFYSMQTVYLYRSELKAELRKLTLQKDFRKQMKAAKREYLLLEDGRFWIPVEYANPENPAHIEAIKRALSVSEDEYRKAENAHKEEVKKLAEARNGR